MNTWLVIVTSALKEKRETGMFSGPPWTSKCLHPALASTYRELSKNVGHILYVGSRWQMMMAYFPEGQ